MLFHAKSCIISASLQLQFVACYVLAVSAANSLWLMWQSANLVVLGHRCFIAFTY